MVRRVRATRDKAASRAFPATGPCSTMLVEMFGGYRSDLKHVIGLSAVSRRLHGLVTRAWRGHRPKAFLLLILLCHLSLHLRVQPLDT